MMLENCDTIYQTYRHTLVYNHQNTCYFIFHSVLLILLLFWFSFMVKYGPIYCSQLSCSNEMHNAYFDLWNVAKDKGKNKYFLYSFRKWKQTSRKLYAWKSEQQIGSTARLFNITVDKKTIQNGHKTIMIYMKKSSFLTKYIDVMCVYIIEMVNRRKKNCAKIKYAK